MNKKIFFNFPHIIVLIAAVVTWLLLIHRYCFDCSPGGTCYFPGFIECVSVVITVPSYWFTTKGGIVVLGGIGGIIASYLIVSLISYFYYKKK
jgi:uncharacterized membrane protein YkgB